MQDSLRAAATAAAPAWYNAPVLVAGVTAFLTLLGTLAAQWMTGRSQKMQSAAATDVERLRRESEERREKARFAREAHDRDWQRRYDLYAEVLTRGERLTFLLTQPSFSEGVFDEQFPTFRESLVRAQLLGTDIAVPSLRQYSEALITWTAQRKRTVAQSTAEEKESRERVRVARRQLLEAMRADLRTEPSITGSDTHLRGAAGGHAPAAAPNGKQQVAEAGARHGGA